MTPEQLEQKRTYNRNRYKNLTIEERKRKLSNYRDKYRNMTSEKREAKRKYTQDYQANLSPEQRERQRIKQHKAARKYLLKGYGLTLMEYDNLLKLQHNRCACCDSKDPRSNNWHVDHDHTTSEVRGILCNVCNTVIGQFGDNLDGLYKWGWPLGIRYLENYPTITAERLVRIRSSTINELSR